MRYITVTPAYGRDYKSSRDALADWHAGKDFEIQDYQYSGYVNKNCVPPEWVITIRYKNRSRVVNVI